MIPPTILVTGGAGFMGSAYVHHLLEVSHARVIVLDALTYAGSTDNLPYGGMPSDRFKFVYGNILNAELVDSLMAQADEVVHFAAESHVTRSIYDNHTFVETDVLGTQVLMAAAVKHRKRIWRFIHISSSEVYGSALHERMDENHPLQPASPYAAAKAGADRLVYSYWYTYGVPVVIVRPFNNYGPRQHLEKVIPRFITSVLLNEPIPVHGAGSSERDWLHVDDLCAGLNAVYHVGDEAIGKTFNLGTGRSTNVVEIAHLIVGLMEASSDLIQYIPERPGQVERHTADIDRARAVLGWAPKVSFETGLRQTIDWYRANEAWWRRRMYARHVEIELPDGRHVVH